MSLPPPFDIYSVSLYLLALFQPSRHLRILVFSVCCLVSFFCEVNVQTLRLFCIVIVSGAKQSDGPGVVK